MGTAVTTADVVQYIIQTMIETIGRKTSEGYAVIAVRDVVKQLQPLHPCLNNLQIRNAQYVEFGSGIDINEKMDEANPQDVGHALQDILILVSTSMRKSAGYFLLKEIREHLDEDHQQALLDMGVDLNFLQFSNEVRNKNPSILTIFPHDVVRRVLKTTLALLEQQVGREFAFKTVDAQVRKAQDPYPFLAAVEIQDTKLTLGTDEVSIDDSIDSIEPHQIGMALDQILHDVNARLQEQGHAPIIEAFKTQLTADYIMKLEEFGVTLFATPSDMTKVLQDTIRAIVTVLTDATSEQYAVFAINNFLQKADTRYAILHAISVQAVQNQDGLSTYDVRISRQDASETEARRAIQGLLSTIIRTLGETLSGSFIEKFSDAMDKSTLIRIEQIGVNLHMISLQEQLRGPRAS